MADMQRAKDTATADACRVTLAVFFGTMPIVDPPYYVGSTIDEGFPDGLKCGMYLPCPGADFPDMPEGSV